jgi:hypothetical protein
MNRFHKRKNPDGWEQYDSLIFGIIVGFLLPFVGLAILMMINEQLAALKIQSGNGTFDGLAERTVRLLAICLNLIPFNIFSKRRMLPSMRGIFLPTILYIGIWLFLHGQGLLSNF